MATLKPITKSAATATATPEQTAAETSQNGKEKVRVSRYTSTCPACDKQITAGQRVVSFLPAGAKRPRWKHEDCDNVPEEIAGGPIPAEVVARIKRLSARIADLENAAPKIIHVRQPDGSDHVVDGCAHEAFDAVLGLAMARKHIFLPGPSGCGKSHMAGQVAEALGLRFGSISCSAGMSESQLLGRMVPHGEQGQFEFLGTEFLDCYENGGVFLFDEIDAADANVLLVINSALANGRMSVPSRHGNPVAKRHPDFVCIAAANTFGTGADRQYVGRNQLDEATLDRFRIGTVAMDYNEALERQLCPDADLFGRLIGYRRRIQENRLNRLVSTRFLIDAYEMVAKWGWTDEQVDAQLFAGWRDDEVAKVRN